MNTLWEKEKLLVTSNFSLFPPVFSTRLEEFVCYRVENIVDKGEIAGFHPVSFSYNVFERLFPQGRQKTSS